jgi:hypothetical protein
LGKVNLFLIAPFAFLLLAHPGTAFAQVSADLTDAQRRAIEENISALNFESYRDDQRGDYQAAVAAAQKCWSLIESGIVPGFEAACSDYYGRALETGKGVDRDDAQAFEVFQRLQQLYPDRESANLAEFYLDGIGVAPDPVEAAVLLWRSEHGYDSYWTMSLLNVLICDGCDEMPVLEAQEAPLDARLDKELTGDQWNEAYSLEAERYPQIEHAVFIRKIEIDIFEAVPWVLIICYVIWRRRSISKEMPEVPRKPLNIEDYL